MQNVQHSRGSALTATGKSAISAHISPSPRKFWPNTLPVIIFLLEGFKEDDSGIAKSAADASLALVRHFHITNILHPGFEYSRKLLAVIDQPTIAGHTEVVKFRVFDFVEAILVEKLGSVGDVLQLGLMEKLFSSFQTMDPLALASNCEAIARFADSSVGLELLEESGIPVIHAFLEVVSVASITCSFDWLLDWLHCE